MSDLGATLLAVRQRAGLSQRSLAIRAGTSQARISRLERGLESPSFERFTTLLLVMGERPVLSTASLSDTAQPRSRLPPEGRLREAASWNLVAMRLEAAGQAARRAGHPATRRTR